jgi:hypothetical protein
MAVRDAGAARRGARELDRGLDRLGSRRREQRDLERFAGEARESFAELRFVRRRAGVADVHGCRGERLGERADQIRMVVPEVRRAEAGEKVRVARAGVVVETRAFAADPDPAVAQHAEHLRERRVDVARVRGANVHRGSALPRPVSL